jgi:glycogen synthase
MSALQSRKGRGLLGNSIAIVAMTNLTAGLGYLFWSACARHVTASAIGMASAVVSAMSLVALLSAGGFVPLLIRALPGTDQEEFRGLSSTALTVTAALAAAGGIAAGLLLPTPVHAALGTPWLVAILVSGAVGTALLLVMNAVLLGLRRADLSLIVYVMASLSRLITIVALLTFGTLLSGIATAAIRTILLVWVASLTMSLGLSLWLLAYAKPGFRFHADRRWLPRLRCGVAWEHLAVLGAQLPGFALPILAAALMPAAQVGYLYITWMVGQVFYTVSAAVATALLADCADRPERLRAQVRRSLQLTGAVLAIPVLVTCLFAPRLLGLFGVEYAHYGSTLLILLVLTSVPDAVVNVAVSVLRLQSRLVSAAALNLATGVVTLLGSWLTLPRLGIAGTGWSALVAQSTGMTVVLVAAHRLRNARGRSVGVPFANSHDGICPLASSATRRDGSVREEEGYLTPMTSSTSNQRPPALLRRTRPVHGEVEDRLRRLRILHASDSFQPNVGGLELAVAELVRAQVTHGHAIAVATPRHPQAPDRENFYGVEVHRLPMTTARIPHAYAEQGRFFFPPVPDPEFGRAFAELVRQFRPDIVHVHGWILYSVLGAARSAAAPVVATAHDSSYVCATKTLLHRGIDPCSGPELRKCLRCAFVHYGPKGIPLVAGLHQIGSRRHRHVAQWLAISSAVAAHGSAPRRADRSAMDVIPTFIDDDLLALATDARTAERPDFVPPTQPYIFYAGVLGTQKGVDVLLDAHGRLCESDVDVPLVLAGPPRRDFQIADRPGVVIVNPVPRSKVVAALRHAAIGVVPSVAEEGFGRVAVECLAAGTPCVVSAIGGLVDVVADGVEGLHVPPGDAASLAAALRRLFDDEDLRTRLGAAGPAKAAQFTLSQVSPRLDEVYLRVLAESSQ